MGLIVGGGWTVTVAVVFAAAHPVLGSPARNVNVSVWSMVVVLNSVPASASGRGIPPGPTASMPMRDPLVPVPFARCQLYTAPATLLVKPIVKPCPEQTVAGVGPVTVMTGVS